MFFQRWWVVLYALAALATVRGGRRRLVSSSFNAPRRRHHHEEKTKRAAPNGGPSIRRYDARYVVACHTRVVQTGPVTKDDENATVLVCGSSCLTDVLKVRLATGELLQRQGWYGPLGLFAFEGGVLEVYSERCGFPSNATAFSSLNSFNLAARLDVYASGPFQTMQLSDVRGPLTSDKATGPITGIGSGRLWGEARTADEAAATNGGGKQTAASFLVPYLFTNGPYTMRADAGPPLTVAAFNIGGDVDRMCHAMWTKHPAKRRFRYPGSSCCRDSADARARLGRFQAATVVLSLTLIMGALAFVFITYRRYVALRSRATAGTPPPTICQALTSLTNERH